MDSRHDLLDVDHLLTDEERAIRDTARRFAQDKLEPHVAEWAETGELPARDIAKQMGGAGLLGMHLRVTAARAWAPTAYGLASIELEAVDSGLRSLFSVQGSLAMYSIHAYGSEEQKQQWLPGMAAGDCVGCFGLTEPDHGSNPDGMRTRAKRDGDDWVLNGSKMWITNGSVADVVVVWAQTDDGIRGFVVPTDTPGFSGRDIKHKMSLRASVTSELTFDGHAPAGGRACCPEAEGLRGPLGCLNEARFGIVFGAIGAARACLETAIDYATTRTQFGKPIGGVPAHPGQARRHERRLQHGACCCASTSAGSRTRASSSPRRSASASSTTCAIALDIARKAATILGANGIIAASTPSCGTPTTSSRC